MRNRNGIALILVAGILTLLAFSGAAMMSLASRLRVQVSTGVDLSAARLLARSGVEYASARLAQDPLSRTPPTPGNQSDDWTCRDDRSVPLEQSLNPSYAQTESYADLNANGRYDRVGDAFPAPADWNANGRFDAWSGRLRGREGMTGTVFTLKVSGEGAEGGIHVNAGWMGDFYRYLGEPNVVGAGPSPEGKGADVYIAGSKVPVGVPSVDPMVDPAIRISRGASSGLNNQWVAFKLNELGTMLGLLTPRPGDRIILNRPKGGYVDREEMARLFPAPDWTRLRPHLTTVGRPVPGYGTGPASSATGYKRRYFFNPGDAAVEAIAAGFSRIGDSGDYISPSEALLLARFLKTERFESWYDLHRKLMAHAEELFLPSQPPQGKFLKAWAAQALARSSFEDFYATTLGQVELESGRRWFWHAGCPEMWSWISYDGDVRKDWVLEFNQDGSANGAVDFGRGPGTFRAIESLGTVSSPRGGRRIAARASALRSLAGGIFADSQREMENLRIDPATDLSSAAWRFDGGAVVGRPIRDRATTYPLFSRDACRDLSPRFSNRYRDDVGEAMLSDYSWLDPDAVFYLPCWDLDQPERPSPAFGELTAYNAFRDFARGVPGARWRLKSGADPEAAARNAVSTWGRPSIEMHTPVRGAPNFNQTVQQFSWSPAGAAPGPDANEGRFPCADAQNAVSEGTVAWINGGDGHVSIANGSDGIFGRYYSWGQNDAGGAKHYWPNPEPVTAEPKIVRQHWLCRFDAVDGAQIYIDGIFRGKTGFDPFVLNSGKDTVISFDGGGTVDEFRLYAKRVDDAKLLQLAHGRQYWIADPMGGVESWRNVIPSFVSPLYSFAGEAQLVEAQWDGFVPARLVESTDAWNRDHPGSIPKIPLRAELLLYPHSNGTGEPRIVPFPEESWRTGGTRVALSRAVAKALRYRVWLDASSDEPALVSPVFDGIEIWFRGHGLLRLRED